MKLAIINTLYTPHVIGGAERSVQLLSEALVGQGVETIVICAGPGPGVNSKVVNGVKVYYVGLRNIYWPFGQRGTVDSLKPLWHMIDIYNPIMARAVAHVLEVEQPDLVHTNNLTGFSVAVWDEITKRTLPIVHTLRDYYLMCPKSVMFRNQRNCARQCAHCKCYSTLKFRQTKRVEAVIGISGYILDRHLHLGYFKHATVKAVIYNPYDANYPPIRANHDCGPLRIGFLGRLEPTKGIELLLQSVRGLPTNDLKVIIGGKGTDDYTGYLRQRYPLPNCEYLGFVKPSQFFPRIDVLVVPSLWHEPMGRTVIEAYAHGIPVIGSDRGGIPELIQEGVTGFLFDPDTPNALRSKLSLALAHPNVTKEMGGKALEKAKEFSAGRIVERYADIYKQVLSAGSSRKLKGLM